MQLHGLGGGDHQVVDQGWIRLFGCRSKSVNAGMDCAAYRPTIPTLSVTQKSAVASAICSAI